MRRKIAWAMAAVLIVAATASGQTGEGQTGGSSSPFFGSATQGTASATPISLSVKDAVERALAVQSRSPAAGRRSQACPWGHDGARLRACCRTSPQGLRPAVRSSTSKPTAFRRIRRSSVRSMCSTRACMPRSRFSISARSNDARAASATERAQTLGIRTARDLVTLVAVNLYLEAVAAASRVEATQAQQATAEALSTQAADMKQAGVVAGIEVVARAGAGSKSAAADDPCRERFRKGKTAARARHWSSTRTGVHARRQDPLCAAFMRSRSTTALKTAFESRADYLAARERLTAAEASRRAAASDHIPTVHLDADYGALGQTVSGSHETYRVAATVRLADFRCRPLDRAAN